MDDRLLRVGEKVVNLADVSAAHWDDGKLYVYFQGGRFTSFGAEDGRLVWQAIAANSVDLRTGEVRE